MKHNKKLPHSPHHDENGGEEDLNADQFHEYKTCHMGTLQSKYRDTGASKNFNSHVGPTGDMHYQDENNDDPVSSESHPGAHRYYTKNASDHHDANKEGYHGGVSNKNTMGQTSSTTTTDKLAGATKNSVALHGNEARIRATSEGIDGSSGGMNIQTTDGDRYNYHQGNVASTFGGAHYSIYQNDFGMHVQKDGNLDMRVEKGKMQLNAAKNEAMFKSGKDMLVQSGTKITLKVGGSSIVITDGEIVITSKSVKFKKG